MAARARPLAPNPSPAGGEGSAAVPQPDGGTGGGTGGFETRSYTVREPLRHDGVDYPVGAGVALAPDAAAPLLALAVVVAAPDAAPGTPA